MLDRVAPKALAPIDDDALRCPSAPSRAVHRVDPPRRPRGVAHETRQRVPQVSQPSAIAVTGFLRAARILALLGLTTLACTSAWGHWSASLSNAPHDAADAVPLYLQGVALREGADPTDAATLAAIKARPQRWALHADVVSTLYPPSMAAPMSHLVGSGWEVFLVRWRAIVLGCLLVGCAAAGWAGAMGRNAALGAALGAVAAVTCFPLTGHALALGQANLLIVGLIGLCTWAAARDRMGTAAAAAALGVAVKLVPGIMLWPLLAARRWRGLSAAAAVGAAILALTLVSIPATRVVVNVIDTVRFQQGVTPAWLTLFPGPVLPFLGVFRFAPLGIITVVMTGVCANATRGRMEAPAVLAAAMALLAAWLGAAASAVGVFYGLLLLPALIRLTVWPLAESAPKWAWACLPFALLPRLFVTADDSTVLASFQMFVVGLAVWLASAGLLLHGAWTALGRIDRGLVLFTLFLAIAFSVTMVATSPAFPTEARGNGTLPIGSPQGPANGGGVPGQHPPHLGGER